jgi:hypothetical protein
MSARTWSSRFARWISPVSRCSHSAAVRGRGIKSRAQGVPLPVGVVKKVVCGPVLVAHAPDTRSWRLSSKSGPRASKAARSGCHVFPGLGRGVKGLVVGPFPGKAAGSNRGVNVAVDNAIVVVDRALLMPAAFALEAVPNGRLVA